ncbi:hypothetical protein, partial [Pseudomonas sp. FW305-42]|uniref:hypothetical protein n=1 Tax=Pseudomonas sp. FW305-42 TaxID=2070677 RepID=UPI001A9121C7
GCESCVKSLLARLIQVRSYWFFDKHGAIRYHVGKRVVWESWPCTAQADSGEEQGGETLSGGPMVISINCWRSYAGFW